tara:strand:+ start:252 stop:497 length:246 start_codon:yes stop_codon:yes gene_type:complete
MFTFYFLMPRLKQNKYLKSEKVNGKFFAVPLTAKWSTSEINSYLDQLTKGKEKVLWHKQGFFKERSIQAIAREMGIRFVED